MAQDVDSGYAGSVQYRVAAGNQLGHFAINSSTGALIVFAPLDRETIAEYKLTIIASDSDATNPRSATTELRWVTEWTAD